MVMEDKIKNAYTVLSGGKKISSDGYIISSGHFNSITRDRFIAELKKNGIAWDGADIPFGLLLKKEAAIASNGKDHSGDLLQKSNIVGSSFDAAVGIDIQDIAQLPVCADFWEDAFYNTRFSPEEIAHCVKKENPVQSFAGIYACKEALIKCNNELGWNQIKLSFNAQGKPFFGNYQVSISHSGNFAVAMACRYPSYEIEKEKSNPVTNEKIQQLAQTNVNNDTVKPTTAGLYPLALLLMLGVIFYFIYRDFIAG